MKHTNNPGKNTIGRLFTVLFLLLTINVLGEENNFTIEYAVKTALVKNERSEIANESLKAARARLLKAKSVFIPSITATGTYTRRPYEVTREINGQTIIVQSLNALGGNINLNWTLFDSRSIPAFRQLKYEEKSQMFTSMEARRALAFEVCNAYLVTMGSQNMVKAARQRFELAAKNLDASRARYQAQLVSINDVTRSELEYATAEQSMTRAIGDAQNAQLELEYLVGEKIDGELVNPSQLLAEAETPPSEPGILIPQAHEQRFDIKALQWYFKAQSAYASEPLLRLIPSLSMVGQYRMTNEAGLTGKNTNWSMGLSMSWTIFDGMIRIGDYKERKALARIAELDVKAASRKLEVDVKNALVSLANQQATLKQSTVALDVARKNAQETSELFRQGLTGALEAADAIVRLYEAQVENIREQYGLAIAYLNLRLAMGQNPFGNDLPRNNQ